ncbi:MAG: hypothetical protein ACP5KN_07600 [Armatimonadota bacterium]
MIASRNRRELRMGCRRGNIPALDALLYQSADGIYAMALSAVPDEEAAQGVVREVWRRLLSALQSPRFGRDPLQRLWHITERVLAERVGARQARAARRAVTAEDGSVGLDGVRLPREVLDELSGASEAAADAIAAQWRLRRNIMRGGIAVLFLLAVGIWAAVLVQRARASHDLEQLQYECLRQRIIRQDLASAMRVVSFQLDDPTGADREAAADCERVVLILEEIANSESLRQVHNLRYIRQRVRKHDLPGFVRSLEDTFPEMARSLPRVALVLEEVQNL